MKHFSCYYFKNDATSAEIYNFPWHLLPKKDQKNYLIMLNKSQNPRILTAGGLTPLNMDLFMSIVKTIYQLFMMMLNFIE